MVKRSICVWVVMSALLTVGCGGGQHGPPRAAVRGSVRLDGEPITQGQINFFPTWETKGPVVGGRIVDGQYELDRTEGPVVGWNRIEISWNRKTGRQVPAGSPSPPGTMIDEITEAVPGKYNVNSTLEREIEAKKNVLDFELTSQ